MKEIKFVEKANIGTMLFGKDIFEELRVHIITEVPIKFNYINPIFTTDQYTRVYHLGRILYTLLSEIGSLLKETSDLSINEVDELISNAHEILCDLCTEPNNDEIVYGIPSDEDKDNVIFEGK